MSSEELLSRILKLLQGAIRVSGATQIQVDAKIGRRRGYLSHVFQRRVDLKLVDMLRILDAISLDSGQFFTPLVTGQPNPKLTPDDLMSLLAGGLDTRHAAPQLAPPPATVPDDAQLEAMVRDTVRQLLREMDGQEAKPGDEQLALG